MSASSSAASGDPNTRLAAPTKNVRLALLGVMLAMLLSMLDNTIVGTSMPTIVGDLGGMNHLSWVVSAYTLATASSTPVWGKFGDLYGRKRVYLIAIVIFLVGSALSGAAQSMIQLIVFRIAQGLGAGGLGAGAFALIGTLVSPRERGRYQGMTATVMAIGTVGGPLLGGVITDNLGWRWAFYINIPLGLIALVWCQVLLRLPAKPVKAAIDWLGITLLTATICAVVLIATWAGSTYAWDSWQIAVLAVVAVGCLVAFLAAQQRASEPVLPLRVFAHRNFRLASVMIFAVGVAMFGATLYLPLFQQTVQKASATNSGLLLLPMMLPVAFVSNVAGKLMSHTGRYKIFPVLGGAFLTLGMVLLATMDTNTSRATTSGYMLLIGIGMGLIMQMATTIAQNSVETCDLGVASASVNLFRTIGGSIGVAVFGSLFSRAVQDQVPHLSGNAGAQPDVTTLEHLPASATDAYLRGVATGSQHLFLAASVICAVAFLAALFVKEVPLCGKPSTDRTEKNTSTDTTPGHTTPAASGHSPD